MSKKREVKDLHLWEQHRQAIKPLHKRHRETVPTPTPEGTSKNRRSIRDDSPRERYAFQNHTDLPASSEKILIQKQVRVRTVCIESRLDLHGMTRQEAFLTLQRFVLGAQQRRYDWILVITGKGEAQNPHTLRNLLPIWLEQLPQVTGYASAKQRDGGSGAFYVRIRKSLP